MEIIIIHDDEKKYFEAIEEMEKNKKIKLQVYYFHFIKFLIKSIIKKNLKMFIVSIKSIIFFFKSFFIKDKIILLGVAPCDFRLMFFLHLLKRNKIIFHNSWPYWLNNAFPQYPVFFKNIIFKVWETFILNDKTYIINIIEKSKEEINLKYKKSLEKIYVIPHCVNDKYYYPPQNKGYNNKILYVGRLVKEKGLKQLREIILYFNTIQFGIIGDGKDKYILKDIFKLANVKYYGYLKNKMELGSIMREYDILLLPSYKTKFWEELFGIVLIEAMACGMVCIATDCIGPRNIIKDGENGFIVKQKDVNEIKEKIIILNKDINLFKKISGNAVKSIDKYKINNIITLWENSLKKISLG